MLRELHVRGLGPLGEVSAAFSPGLNVVTGETGAGKTLLVTSLALLSGARGSARLVGEGAAEAVAQAVVDVPDRLRPALDDLGVDDTDELILARRLGADGRSRAWVGGRLVPVSTLGEIVQSLIEIHGQGAGFALATPSVQLAALDQIADVGELLTAYRTTLRCVRDLGAERERLASADDEREREADYLRHQADEIDRLAPVPGEDAALVAEISRLENAETIELACGLATDIVGPDGAAGQLGEAVRTLETALAYDRSLSPLHERLTGLAVEAGDLAGDLRRARDGVDADPSHLERIRERHGVLSALKRKHGAELAEVIERGAAARARADELTGAAGRVAEIDRTLRTLREELSGLAHDLTERRRGAAERLTTLVASELPALALPNAAFRVACEDRGAFGERGRDGVRFLFSADARRELQPIAKAASGGELSRTMIAVTLALAKAHPLATLVFDEADQGVGGEAALEVARRLARLGTTHQVLVVSHLPQLAAFADNHVHVAKAEDGATASTLDADGRLDELSRMLAGLSTSDRARAHAKELLDLAAVEARERPSLVG